MASITINDLEQNQELDRKALQDISGGRWVRRVTYQRYYAYYYRTIRRRVTMWRTYRVRIRRLRIRRVIRWVWI